jgi:signal transduction histidine kinase
MYGTTQDVTEMVSAEERLRSMNEKLQALSARLESAREEESIHIARELHDELGGTLTGLQWDLQSISQRLKNIDMGAGDRAHVQGKIEGMGQLIDSSLETVRRISSELRPLILDDLGLKAAVEWRADQFQAQTGITVVCHCQTEAEDLGRSQALAVYRILQEALTNVLRHAQATRVDLFMSSTDAEFILEIRDNGRGISDEENNISGSLGLLGMHERAQLMGGEFSITGTPGKGTTVTVRVPLDRAAGEV